MLPPCGAGSIVPRLGDVIGASVIANSAMAAATPTSTTMALSNRASGRSRRIQRFARTGEAIP